MRRWGRVPKLLALADSGGSNSCRAWAWKTEIQAQVCDAFGFTVTIAHYPTGASKWNPIEHRLFSGAQHPEHLEQAQRVLGVPFKRTDQRVIEYLDRTEIESVLAGIDRKTADGRRDYALLATMFNMGARV